MTNPVPKICVFGPNLTATVTVERAPDGSDDIHFHAGGQGFWIARMAVKLGEPTALCAPVGGEAGEVVRPLVARAGVQLISVAVGASSPAYLHDRRDGGRTQLAHNGESLSDRHDRDELYGALLTQAMSSDVLVLTGSAAPGVLPDDFYRRLGSDLAAARVTVLADLHGSHLDAFLAGGPITVLKVSDEDLFEDGVLEHRGRDDAARRAVGDLHDRRCENVVLSRARDADLALFDGGWYEVRSPRLEELDHRGAGDSMTAALAVAMVRGLDPGDALRIARAAGAANVTRHGLASTDVGLVASLTTMVEVDRLDDDRR